MSNLEELIKYWKNSYSSNYTQRQPLTNQRILDTITYLKQLQNIKGTAPINKTLLKGETLGKL